MAQSRREHQDKVLLKTFQSTLHTYTNRKNRFGIHSFVLSLSHLFFPAIHITSINHIISNERKRTQQVNHPTQPNPTQPIPNQEKKKGGMYIHISMNHSLTHSTQSVIIHLISSIPLFPPSSSIIIITKQFFPLSPTNTHSTAQHIHQSIPTRHL